MADTANGDYHHEQASRQASKGRLYSSNGGLDAEKADEEKRPGWNGDDTGGRVFRYLLGDAKGYDQMSRADKLSLFKNELLLGLIICFAQIPESVAFGFLANVQPSVAIHSAWIVGLICSAFGGRPAMVNGATGAFAAIIGTFIAAADKNSESGEGVERLFVSVMLAGGLMLLVAGLRLSRLIVLVPSTVMIGFCNGLAIVIGMAQLHPFGYECKEVNDECPVKDDKHHWRGGGELGWMIAVMIISMLIMEFIPRLPWRYAKVVPSSLVSIVVAIIIEFAIIRQTGQRTNTIGDIAPFDSETAFPLPFFADNVRYEVDSPVVSKNLSNSTINSNTTQSTPLGPLRYDLSKLSGLSGSEVWSIILNGILLAAVGVIESLMTMEVVNKFTKTEGDRNRTVVAMGAANIVSGFFGGMGGNAMIGLSTINCLNGGKGRLAPLVTALVIMIMVMGAYPALNYIPVSALAGIMLVVVLHTFKWFSLPMVVSFFLPEHIRDRYGRHYKVNRLDVLVIVGVTVITILTNLVYAVGFGIALTAIIYSYQSAQTMTVTSDMLDDRTKIYHVDGPFFFANRMNFDKFFAFEKDPENIEIHFSGSILFDYSALESLNGVCVQYAELGKKVRVRHLHPSAERIFSKAADLVRNINYTPGEDVDVALVRQTGGCGAVITDGEPQMIISSC